MSQEPDTPREEAAPEAPEEKGADSESKTTLPDLPSIKQDPDLEAICRDRAGTMIGEGYAWCKCGIEPIRHNMGHRTCQHC